MVEGPKRSYIRQDHNRLFTILFLFRMESYNAKDLALAEILNKDKFPVEVDITQDVLSERIPKEELADALDGEKELNRLKLELKEAHGAWLRAKTFQEQLDSQKLRRKMLLEKKVPPQDENDKQLTNTF